MMMDSPDLQFVAVPGSDRLVDDQDQETDLGQAIWDAKRVSPEAWGDMRI